MGRERGGVEEREDSEREREREREREMRAYNTVCILLMESITFTLANFIEHSLASRVTYGQNVL